MAEQLIKKTGEGYSNVMPKSWIEAITDKSTGESLTHILQGFNMYFLSYTGNTEQTRCQVPKILRKKGLWITYVKYDGNVYTEWYNSDNIDDKSWGNSSNWRIGNNELVGDLTISANGNWVINGNETEFKAIGEKGNTPLIRIADNKLQVSYDGGDTYNNVSDNPVYTKFRWQSSQNDNVGNIQFSIDDGKTWKNFSSTFVNNLHISRYIGANETLPTSGVVEGTIYAKGPTYAESDASHSNPIYRLWVYAYKGNTLAWQDNGEFTSINAGITQELGNSESLVVSQKCISDNISKITNTLFPQEVSTIVSIDEKYNIGQTYIVKKTNLHVNAGVEYNITIQGTVVSNTTVLRLMDENNSQIIVIEIDGSRGNGNRTITFTPPQSGYIALIVLELKEYGSYTIKPTLVKDDSITSTVERLTKKVDEVSDGLKNNSDEILTMNNTLYGNVNILTEEYDFTKSHIQDTYVVQKGNLKISKGHKYEITISPSENGMNSFLRIYDASNTSTLQSEIPNSSGESHRTITFECEFDGKIAVVIRTLTKLCTVSLTVKDVTNVGGIVKKIEQLEDSNSIIKQLKVLVIGDSITTGSSSAKLSSVNMPSYGKYEKWVDILIKLGLFNSDTINCSQHATGFVAKNGSSEWVNNSDFLSRLKYFVNNNTINPSTIDLIIVFGGINDFKLPCEIGEFGEKDTTKFIPALEAFYNYLEETFTQARIVVCTPTRCAVATGQTDWSTRVDWAPNEGFIADENSLRITYDTYVDAIKKCCKKYSLPVIDLAYESGFMPLNKKNREKWSFVFDESASIPTDGIHPNYDFQQKMLAPMIYSFVSKLFISQNNSL